MDFIKRYIFPGCCISAVSAFAQAMADSSGLRILPLEDIGPHYATTLARWRDNFLLQILGKFSKSSDDLHHGPEIFQG